MGLNIVKKNNRLVATITKTTTKKKTKKVTEAKIIKFVRDNLLNIVGAAWHYGWGDTLCNEDEEWTKIFPKEYASVITEIHIPRHRDGEFEGDFIVYGNFKNAIHITCTKEELGVCKAHFNGLHLSERLANISRNDPKYFELWTRATRRLQHE